MKITVILNPQSMNGTISHMKAILEQNLGNALMGIEETVCPYRAVTVARQAIEKGADTIVTAGGDGTVNSVLGTLASADIVLGVLPMGTANDLATLYQIPVDLRKACRVILERQLHRADLIRVNTQHYITGGGLGLPSRIAQIANTIKQHRGTGKGICRRVGSQLYLFTALYALLKEGPRHNDRLYIRWNGGSLITRSLSLMVSNQPFTGKCFFMSPAASNDDGLFDVCLIENTNRRTRILSTFLKILAGRHVNSQWVKAWRAAELFIDSERPVAFFGDGEVLSIASHFRISILPRALNVIVPEHIARNKYPTLDEETSTLCLAN